jgi:single-strand DNA-binding protein
MLFVKRLNGDTDTMNVVILIGNLASDPEVRATNTGKNVTNFRLAVNGYAKNQTDFFNCIAWDKTGEVIALYCKKGRKIAVEGRLQQRSWTTDAGDKRSVVEVVVGRCTFLSAADGVPPNVPVSASDTLAAQVFDGTSSNSVNPDDNVPF